MILRDTAGLDAWAIAEQTDTPLATFDFTPAQSVRLHEVAGGEFAWFREAMSLPPEPSGDRLGSQLDHRRGSTELVRRAQAAGEHALRAADGARSRTGESVEALLDGEDERPLLYATFGTVFNTPDLFQLVFDAVADLDVRVIATIGMNNEAADMAIPDNVRTVPFLSQGLILEHADMVVAHGGYGSLTGALKRGLPVLSLPLAPPDNAFNAAQLVKLGAGLALGPDERTPEAIRRSLRRLLDDRKYRDRAGEIAAEIAALPPIDHAAELIERLAMPDD